jgi:hypothetical protein
MRVCVVGEGRSICDEKWLGREETKPRDESALYAWESE